MLVQIPRILLHCCHNLLLHSTWLSVVRGSSSQLLVVLQLLRCVDGREVTGYLRTCFPGVRRGLFRGVLCHPPCQGHFLCTVLPCRLAPSLVLLAYVVLHTLAEWHVVGWPAVPMKQLPAVQCSQYGVRKLQTLSLCALSPLLISHSRLSNGIPIHGTFFL
uniref:Secreted protein n=1 Tax=Lygus hesperus TaxID=30085 RepID=A0A146M6Y6_LYGHE